MAQNLTIFIHLIGFGLVCTVQLTGILLELRYRKAKDLQSKASILTLIKPFGILSPVSVLIMLITGIGNMEFLGFGIFSAGWLTAKIIFFALLVIAGLIFGLKSRQRGSIIQSMIKGDGVPGPKELLLNTEKQITLSYIVMPILLLIILLLTVYGTR